MKKDSQIWSMDLVIGVVIFLFLIIVFLSFITISEPEDFEVRAQADTIFQRFDSATGQQNLPPIFDGIRVNEVALNQLFGASYNAIKRDLGISGDFCIVVLDDQGGLINFSDRWSFGNSQDLEIADGVVCGD